MADRTKRIFISDIHMGDDRSMKDPNHYGWFKKNIPLLAKFLNEQLKAPDVKEVVILGDLFDDWVIPVDSEPLKSFDSICLNPDNKPVIDMLKELADSDIKLAYVPGNHDMSLNDGDITSTRQFLEKTFRGIRYICNSNMPFGTYNIGNLAAEHGNRYCLFNAPDPGASEIFIPLGYFITRLVAYKVKTGFKKDPRKVFIDFLQRIFPDHNLEKSVFKAIVEDAGLSPNDKISMGGIKGYPDTITIEEIGNRFVDLVKRWNQLSGHIDLLNAVWGDLGYLSVAASEFFQKSHLNTNIVIFGHTHNPIMEKSRRDPTNDNPSEPCISIYANSGTWVDQGKYCSYVETEERQDVRQHYVRVKNYQKTKTTTVYEGYVLM